VDMARMSMSGDLYSPPAPLPTTFRFFLDRTSAVRCVRVRNLVFCIPPAYVVDRTYSRIRRDLNAIMLERKTDS